jgi:hypothetical protein
MAHSQHSGNGGKDRVCALRLSRLGLGLRIANRSVRLGYAVILLVFLALPAFALAWMFAFLGPNPSVRTACVPGLIGTCIVAGAAAFVVFALRDIRQSLRLLEFGAPSLAKLTKVGFATMSPGPGHPVPINYLGLIAYEFQTAAGQAVCGEDGQPPLRCPIHVGDRLLVLYDPVRPSDHQIDYFDARQADRLQLEAEGGSTAGPSPQKNECADRDGSDAVKGDRETGVRQGLPPSTMACEMNDPMGASLKGGKDDERLREMEPGQNESRAALVFLRCVGALTLIIGGVWYWNHWNAEIKNKADADVQRFQRNLERQKESNLKNRHADWLKERDRQMAPVIDAMQWSKNPKK